jgi:hypothetical protein
MLNLTQSDLLYAQDYREMLFAVFRKFSNEIKLFIDLQEKSPDE